MNGESGYEKDPDDPANDLEDDVESEADSNDGLIADDDGADDDDGDNVGDMSVEINVEELVAKIGSDDADEASRKREVRRRLEELQEQKRAARDLDSTYNFNFDDDL